MAIKFPSSEFHGFDISEHALHHASERLKGLPNVTLHNPAKGDGMADGAFDFILTIDAVHDMAHPDKVLPIVRRAVRDGGVGYVVGDFRSCGSLPANIREMRELAMIAYTISVQLCMSAGLSEEGGMGLGTLGFHERLAHSMLKDAGFREVKTLDWGHPVNTFYHACP
jgi:ubiquinone/menaquinone biosynthesis C-methylase UbiE